MNFASLAAPDGNEKKELTKYLRFFSRMYRPHKSREDTVLFPAFHSMLSQQEYDSLGEKFEDKENELFGENGFEKVVEGVAGMERALGIYELSQFTPPI
jgi:hemerythrin-like domain-containing protein